MMSKAFIDVALKMLDRDPENLCPLIYERCGVEHSESPPCMDYNEAYWRNHDKAYSLTLTLAAIRLQQLLERRRKESVLNGVLSDFIADAVKN